MDARLVDLFKKQISLTEWFEAIGHPQTAALREEDAHKHERLGTLNQVIGLPFGKPTRFSGEAVAKRTAAVAAYIKKHGSELCAIRLLPKKPGAPKLRMRGYSVADAAKWFDEQDINPKDYSVDFVPHDSPQWATIFTVGDRGIFGEVKRGNPSQLTQGVYDDAAPTSFSYDFTNWHFDGKLAGAQEHLAHVVSLILVADAAKRQLLTDKLGAKFAANYLQGYFETSTSDDFGVWFVDYNRLLGDLYGSVTNPTKQQALVRGRTGSPGKATGNVRIVPPEALTRTKLTKADILVCAMTTPDYIPLMQQAAAIVTDLGGVLSHAAIVARELKKPCVTGTKNATSVLTDGQRVCVDADAGSVVPA